MECLEHFKGIVLSLACILTKQHGIRGGNCLLKTPGNGISETLNFKISLVAMALKNLCLWCEFQSRLLSITQEKITDNFPFLDIFGYVKNTHKNPKFGRVRRVPIWELGWKFPGWDLSHFAKFGIFMGIL